LESGEALLSYVLKVFWVALRIGSAWMFFPILSQRQIPAIVRFTTALTFSVALLPSVGPHLPNLEFSNLPSGGVLFLEILKELTIGIGLGLVAKWMFSTCVASAQWIGTQLGFAGGGMVNPDFEFEDSAWTEFHNWIAVMFFLALGGHWFLLQALRDSYLFDFSNLYARLGDSRVVSGFWVEIGTQFFFWMLKLSGPLVVVVLLLQAAMGVLSRFVPQINVWMVSIPLTLGIGTFVFTLLSPLYSDALASLFKSSFEMNYQWLHVIGVR
jgi:flagellar biosynthetic protein FliR